MILPVLVALVGAAAQAAAESALGAGTSWLETVDAGRYAASWEAAAPYFQKVIKKRKWVETLQVVRKPLGRVVSRRLYSQEVRDSLPGAPDGRYTVLKFDTSFERKRVSREMLTLVQVPDRRWRVVGYFIR